MFIKDVTACKKWEFFTKFATVKRTKIDITMKKITSLLATAALLAACSGNQGYTVNGTVEGAADGDLVYLQMREGRQLVKLDSAVITNGTFTLEGKQDTVVNCILSYRADGQTQLSMDFFLENAPINVRLAAYDYHASGTPNNDAYQEIRTICDDLERQIHETRKAMQDSTLTEEQREAQSATIDALEDKEIEAIKAGIAKNITNPVGVYLLKSTFYYMSVEELDPLMSQIPATYTNDKVIVRIKDNVEKLKATAVGQKFTDFEMQTPEGKTVKLSDYVGKGKIVLVDFWASWCGPCRLEMPNLVEAYKKYHNKNFEIVGVSLDRTAEDWKKGIEKLHITWPQMSDLKYWDCEGAKLYAVSSIPHTVLIDGEGIILARGLHGDGLQEKLAEVLGTSQR